MPLEGSLISCLSLLFSHFLYRQEKSFLFISYYNNHHLIEDNDDGWSHEKEIPQFPAGLRRLKHPRVGGLTEKLWNYCTVPHDHDRAAGGGVIFLGVINA